jgi:hypothetical protein
MMYISPSTELKKSKKQAGKGAQQFVQFKRWLLKTMGILRESAVWYVTRQSVSETNYKK